MCEQPRLPKLCFSNSLIYHNTIFWLYYTTTYLEKNPKPPSAVARRVFCRENRHFKKTPTSFLLTGQLLCKPGKCLTFPRRAPGVIHHYPNLTELWAHRAKPLIFTCSPTLGPISSIKTRKAIMGPRWANWFPKTDLVCKTAISYKKTKSSLRAQCEISHAVSFTGADFKLLKI